VIPFLLRPNYIQNKRVLVTGGAGFIDSTLANRLASDNDVIAVDDTYLGDPDNLDPEVEFVVASVLDDDFPADVDVLFHLAALSSRNIHEENPQRGCRVNVVGSSTPSSAPAARGLTSSSTPPFPRSTAAAPRPPPSAWMWRRTPPTRPRSSPASATPSTTPPTTR
jgi:hypothetical protein